MNYTMEQALKEKYQQECSITEKCPVEGSRFQSPSSMHIVDPLEISSEPQQNQGPASDVINPSVPSTREVTIDTNGDPRKESLVNIPKIVEMVPKSNTCTTDIQLRKTGVLTEPPQPEGTVRISPAKELNNDMDRSPKTLREKKERYLKKANESKSFVSRSYMKKEFEHKSITEVLLEDRKKADSTSLNQSNISVGAISSLLSSKKSDTSSQHDSNIEDGVVPSKMKTSDDPSSGRLKAENHSNELNPMSKEEEPSPYVESHFAPSDQTKMKNNPLSEDSVPVFIPIKYSSQAKRENNVGKTNHTNETISRNVLPFDKQNPGPHQDPLDDVNLQDNEAETVDNVPSENKIDVDVELQPSSALTATCTSPVDGKNEIENYKEKNVEVETKTSSCPETRIPVDENPKEISQTHSSQNRDSPELLFYTEKKSPHLCPDSKTDTGAENRIINDLPLATDADHSQNKIKMGVKKSNDTNIKINGYSSDNEVESDLSSMHHSSSIRIEPNILEKNDFNDEVTNNEENSSKSVSSGLSLSDIATKELAYLMNDIEMYSRATLAVLKAETMPVIPNIKFRIPSPLEVEPELPEPLRTMYATKGYLDPNLPIQRATHIQNIYNPFSVEREEAGEEVPSSSAAGQSSDEDISSTPIQVFNSKADPHSTVIFAGDDGSLVQTMLNKSPSLIEEQQLNPQFNEVLPDDSHSDDVPDLEDEPMDLEILPDRRRGGIVYPGIPTPAPQNPAPVPVPEREPSPDQNQETVPEEESPPEPQPIPAPQPTPEPQEQQQNTVPEEQSTSEPTSKPEGTSPNSKTNEGPSEQSEDEDVASPPNQSEGDEMIHEQNISSPRRDISEPGDLSKYVRQSDATKEDELLSEGIIRSPDIQNHVKNPVINVQTPTNLTEESDNQSTMYDSVTVPVSPDRNIIPPKPQSSLLQDEISDEHKSVTQGPIKLDQENSLHSSPLVVDPNHELKKPRNSRTHRDEDKTKATEHLAGAVIDSVPVPDWPSTDDEVPQPGTPPPAPYDRQNGPMPTAQGNRLPLSELPGLPSTQKRSSENKELTSNKGIIRKVYPSNRRRTISLNQPTSPKFKPIYHPGTNNEYASILHQEGIERKKPREVVHIPAQKITEHSGVHEDDHMDIEMPLDSRSDGKSMNIVDIPERAHLIPAMLIEGIPSPSLEENIPSITNEIESEQKPSEKATKTSDSKSAQTSGDETIPGIISCTQPSGSEETTRRDSSDSNQQDTTESIGTSQKSSKVETSSSTSTNTEPAEGGLNMGGSGSDDDDDDNTQKRSGPTSNEPPEGYPEVQKEEKHEEIEEQREESQKNKTYVEPRVLLTRSKSDESAPRIEETAKLGARTLSKSNEGTISYSRDEQSMDRSSESSGEEYLQPIQNVASVITEPSTESTSAVQNPNRGREEDQRLEIEATSTKRKEAPSPETSEIGPNKLLAREDGSGRSVPETQELEVENVGVIRPARITQRRQPVPIESDISDIDRGLSESGISEVDGSSDRDASAGEVSETSDDYAARRRLTRNQAAQIEAHQLQQQRAGIGLVSSEYDREQSSPSPEPATASRPSVIFTSTVAYDSSDSGSTLVPKDSASSAKSSENTLSSNSNEQAEISVCVPRQLPRLEDLGLPQDADYEMETLYYRRRPTSDPLVEVLEIVSPPHSDKRKRSSPADAAESKKIKTEKDGDQQCTSAEVDQNGEVTMIDVNPEEPVSDSDREVASIMATQIKEEKPNLKNQIRKLSIFIPQDNIDRTQVVLFPPRTRGESSFVPYLPLKKMEVMVSGNDKLDSPEAANIAAMPGESREIPKVEITEQPKYESFEPLKDGTTAFLEEESTEHCQELSTSKDRRESLGVSKQECSAGSRRSSLRKRESLEPAKKDSQESTASTSKTEAGSSKRDSLKPYQKGKAWKSVKTTPPVVTPPLNQNKSTEPPAAPRRSISDMNKGGGTCKEPTNKKTQRDDKEDPDSSSKGRNAGRRQTKSPIKKAMFRR